MGDNLNAPHGGILKDMMASPERVADMRELSVDWPSWDLPGRQLSDLELLLNGGFSPLSGFMTSTDYDRVRSEMRLADGTLWPIPLTLDVTEQLATDLAKEKTLALRGEPLWVE